MMTAKISSGGRRSFIYESFNRGKNNNMIEWLDALARKTFCVLGGEIKRIGEDGIHVPDYRPL